MVFLIKFQLAVNVTMQIDEDATVGVEAFSRIAPAVPIIANVIISSYIFEFLTASTGGRLQFSTYEKYLIALERYLIFLQSDFLFLMLMACVSWESCSGA